MTQCLSSKNWSCPCEDTRISNFVTDILTSYRTGKILYAIGNVLWAQGRFDESFSYHLRCLKQYKTTVGTNHHRVGDTYHRLAFYYIHKGIYTEAE